MACVNAEVNADERQGGNNVSRDGDEGLYPMYVKLVSSDNHEFFIKREAAMVSGTIKTMLSSPGHFIERQTNVINFPNIDSKILKILCQYFLYRKKYENSGEVPSFPIPSVIALELLIAAHYLDC